MKTVKKLNIIIISALICSAVLKSCVTENAPAEVTEKSSECDILEFTDSVALVNWEINDTNITPFYADWIDLSTITPLITISPKASVNPPSGTETDFSDEKEVIYTVTAENGTEKVYKAHIPANKVLGKWKLIEVLIFEDQNQQQIDYSEKNIFYEFQENNKLVITGNMDDLFIFDNFQAGVHYYEYRKANLCPWCLPDKNLTIDNPEFGQRGSSYYCFIYENKTMRISLNKVIEGLSYVGYKYFSKLN